MIRLVLWVTVLVAACGPAAPTLMTPERCQSLNGEPIGDPGNGSVVQAGCPSGRRLLGYLSGMTEGGLCCAR